MSMYALHLPSSYLLSYVTGAIFLLSMYQVGFLKTVYIPSTSFGKFADNWQDEFTCKGKARAGLAGAKCL